MRLISVIFYVPVDQGNLIPSDFLFRTICPDTLSSHHRRHPTHPQGEVAAASSRKLSGILNRCQKYFPTPAFSHIIHTGGKESGEEEKNFLQQQLNECSFKIAQFSTLFFLFFSRESEKKTLSFIFSCHKQIVSCPGFVLFFFSFCCCVPANLTSSFLLPPSLNLMPIYPTCLQ